MMLTLYPPITPFATHQLAVSDLHTVYVEECGNPQGLPVLFVHGGPGGGCNDDHRRYFDPALYRIVLFDQRGCGRSLPHAELTDNNTQTLVSDMEAIRHYLNIDCWVVFGGSWGSTLSLVYAQTCPERVSGLILRGIFLCRDEEIRWFYQYGAHQIFPDYWQDFIAPIPADERHDMISAYYQRLTSQDEITRLTAAKAWSVWEARCSTLHASPNLEHKFAESHFALSFARIECHYFIKNAFLQPEQILNDMPRIQHIPGIIVHGRYDIVCPVKNAWELHQAWPHSELRIIRDAGHAASEAGTTDALIHATREMAKRLHR